MANVMDNDRMIQSICHGLFVQSFPVLEQPIVSMSQPLIGGYMVSLTAIHPEDSSKLLGICMNIGDRHLRMLQFWPLERLVLRIQTIFSLMAKRLIKQIAALA